jgi:alanine racemase
MFTARFSQIAALLHKRPLQQHSDPAISIALTDSRKLLFPEQSIFFAISSTQKNANDFILPLYQKGVRCFVVQQITDALQAALVEANIIVVEDVTTSLQQIAAGHRARFNFPVIGITGSNGKTIVKEWLFQLLNEQYNIVRSPKSYNSQVGVPLSVLQIDKEHDLGIFEAGISTTGEMEKLKKIIEPTMGIFTFLGSAHNEGFQQEQEKIEEKLKLFSGVSTLFCCADEKQLYAAIRQFSKDHSIELFTWGKNAESTILVQEQVIKDEGTQVLLRFRDQEFSLLIPFTDKASIHNCMTAVTVLLKLKYPVKNIAEKIRNLRPVEMRLELKQAINNCSLINDSYSTDIHSLTIALDFLSQQTLHDKRSLILSDLLQTGKTAEDLYHTIAAIVKGKKLHRFIGIGPEMVAYQALFDNIHHTHFYENTEAFIAALPSLQIANETVLLKGARIFKFEKISKLLEQKQHQTFLEINLNALRHNIRIYKEFLHPGVKMMCMVKAFSYGSGSAEIAAVLQHAAVDYLGVAYADEGVELRKAGITLPIMVMNTEEAGFQQILQYNLQPELYSFRIMQSFEQFLSTAAVEEFPVHIKFETGMNRLGFEAAQLEELCEYLAQSRFKVISFFSHLAGGSEASHDQFTQQQAEKLLAASNILREALGYSFFTHIANTSAIHRHPLLQMDMVRLGIGMYGVDSHPDIQKKLQNVTTLRTTISQIKTIEPGESVGYSRTFIATSPMKIATVRIGYADGYFRSFSNGKGKMLVNGQLAAVVGRVCMDMTMIDITDLDAAEEDEVLVFGEELHVNLLAEWADTIPYEILTSISQRVRRLYFEE